MLIEKPERLTRTFAALADPTRREILHALARGETAAGKLAARFPISGPAISRHLRVLEDAGLIARRVDGKHRRCRLKPEPLRGAAQWLEFYQQFWSESLRQLADHFDPPKTVKPLIKRRPYGHRKRNGK